MCDELRWVINLMVSDIPRIISSGMSERRLHVFTDAALENCNSEGSLGMTAVYVDQGSVKEKFFFSSTVREQVMSEWQQRTKKIISTLELFAAVLALELLSKSFKNVRVFLFIDNEPSRASLISMKSSVEFHNYLLRRLIGIVQQARLYVWTARVPSSSNPADKPSRKVIKHLLKEGFKRLDVDWRRKVHLTREPKISCYQVLVTLVRPQCFHFCSTCVCVLCSPTCRIKWGICRCTLLCECFARQPFCLYVDVSAVRGVARWSPPFIKKGLFKALCFSTGKEGLKQECFDTSVIALCFKGECRMNMYDM